MADDDWIEITEMDDGGLLYTPVIYKAVRSGDIEKVKALLDEGHDPNQRRTYLNAGCTWDWGCPLDAAVNRNDLPMVKLLLSHGAEIKDRSLGDDPPIVTALMSNNIEMVELLIEHGAGITACYAPPDYDKTPFYTALRHSSAEIIELLFRKGASVPKKPWISRSEAGKARKAIHDGDLEKAGEIMAMNYRLWDAGIEDAIRKKDHRKLICLLSHSIKPEECETDGRQEGVGGKP